ncbi:winged helix DNA-binding domain-containing protein [Pseudonocardia lacus]|uniref:winged helix DNA-binding domain-containing protein n=1 Tax=Pseudonocardia lacus TaxID=2835865 RepID=UPI0027E32EF8|nr:winged helix DNA-binding domain-containing protein [Pseudonocardia lacus]
MRKRTPAGPTLTVAQLNRAVLARQLLLERSGLSLPEVAGRVAGLQTQYAPSGYVGMWSRVRDFRREQLTAALLAGEIVQGWVMRCTIHMVAAADYPPFTEAVRAPRRVWWQRSAGAAGEVDMDAVADLVRGYLAEGPLKQAELQQRLLADGLPREVWPGVQLWVDLVRHPSAGTWERPRAHVYALAGPDLVPDPPLDVAASRDMLARRYLGAFGPASAKDVASFCGWSVTEARAVLARLELRRFADEAGGELVDLPDAPLPDADTPAPVRFLGQWEAVLLAHARRAQVLPDEHRSKVFHVRMPQSIRTFLVDGRVAGTWTVDGGLRWQPFAPLDPAWQRAVEEEAERLTAFHDADS